MYGLCLCALIYIPHARSARNKGRLLKLCVLFGSPLGDLAARGTRCQVFARVRCGRCTRAVSLPSFSLDAVYGVLHSEKKRQNYKVELRSETCQTIALKKKCQLFFFFFFSTVGIFSLLAQLRALDVKGCIHPVPSVVFEMLFRNERLHRAVSAAGFVVVCARSRCYMHIT